MASPRPSVSTTEILFTPARANKALPLVRSIVSDIVEKAAELRGRTALSKNPDDDEELKGLRDEIAELVAELESLGCEFKDPSYEVGLVDFPARIDDRDVLLCWRGDEPSVAYYHTRGEGFAGRKPIPPELLEASED